LRHAEQKCASVPTIAADRFARHLHSKPQCDATVPTFLSEIDTPMLVSGRSNGT
jgi:hypothetical protein